MNSWILFLKSHKYGTFGPPFRMGISNQRSPMAVCLRPAGVDALAAPSPSPTTSLFHIASLAPDGSEFGDLICTLPPTSQLHVHFSFPFSFIPLSLGSASSLISTVPKELITSSFFIFFPLFQLNHSPFLPLSPSHPTEFLSLMLEIVFITVKHERQDFPQMNWDDLSFEKITPKQTF